jgi:tetratricopeptide (TPR) repeat protein
MTLRHHIGCILIVVLAVVSAKAQDMTEMSAKVIELIQNEDHGKAVKLLDRMIALRPDSVDLYTMKASSLCRSGKAEESFKIYDRAFALDAKNARAFLDRGNCFMDIGHLDKAVQDFTEGIGHTDNDTLLLILYMNRAAARRGYRDFKGELEDNIKALEYDSSNVGVHNNIGLTYSEKKDYVKAEYHLRKVLELDSLFPGGLMNLGFLYSEMERFEDALRILDLACSKFSDEPYVFNNRGFVKHELGDSKGGIRDIEHSLKLFANNSYAYRNLALIYSDLGDSEKSCTMANEAIKRGFTATYGEEMKKFYIKNCTK